MKSLASIFLFLMLPMAGFSDSYTNPDFIYGDATTAPGYMVNRARDHYQAPSRLFSGDIINGLYGRGYNGSAFTTSNRVGIEFQATETWTTTANGSQILFKVTPPGSTTPITAMTINGSTVSFSGGFSLSSSTVIDAFTPSFGAVTAGSTSTVTWTEAIDRLGEFVTSSFTVTSGGYYEINANSGISQTAGSGCLIIKVNGTSPSGGSACNQGVTALASILDVSITKILNLSVGDIVRIDASATTANATFLSAGLTIKELP